MRVANDNNDTEFERITNKLETALESTDYGWGTPLGELVGGEVKDMLKDGRAWSETDRDIEWMRAAEAKFDQYCRSLFSGGPERGGSRHVLATAPRDVPAQRLAYPVARQVEDDETVPHAGQAAR